MSRAGAKSRGRKHEDERMPHPADAIPLKPEVVRRYEHGVREQQASMIFALCRTKLLERHLAPGDVKGAMIAESVLAQIAVRMAEARSKIVVPKPGMMVPR